MSTTAAELAIRLTADASDASDAFESVGDSAVAMANDVDAAADKADAAASKLDGVASSADNLDSKAGAATASLGGLATGAELVGMEGLAGGLGLAGQATDALSGAGQGLALVLQLESVQSAKAAASSAAHAVATTAQSAAAKAGAAAQWAMNAALSANPIGAVVVLIIAIVAALALAYNKSETFRSAVDAAGDVAQAAFELVWDAIMAIPDAIQDGIDQVDELGPAVGVAKDLVVNYFELMTLPIRTVIGLVQDLIGFIKDIDFPDLPDLPGLGRVAAGGAAGGPGFSGLAHQPAWTVVNITVQGAVDRAGTARQLAELLREYGTLQLGEASP